MQDLLLVFSFVSEHIHLAGWMSFIALIWKISRFFTKATSAIDKLEAVDKTVTAVATNHLPHLEEHMKEINETLKGVRQDIFTVVLSRLKDE